MVNGVKEKIMNLFKRNIAKDYSKPTRFNIVYVVEKKPRKPKIKKTIQREDNKRGCKKSF